jgi:hypothetical protein
MIVRYGQLNGYAGVKPGHPLWGVDYDDCELPYEGEARIDMWRIEVHGGITWSGTFSYMEEDIWWIGFDTAHFGDDKRNWTIQDIKEEIELLTKQLKLVGG